jgi:thiamine biosynthesis protein ThiC
VIFKQRSLFKVTSTSLLDKNVAFMTVHGSIVSQRLHAMNDANRLTGIILECIMLPGDLNFVYI